MKEASLPPSEARSKITAGYERFKSGASTHGSGTNAERRQALLGGQAPYATVLTCADSRLCPEHIFDAGLGDVFVCRNAGNLVDELTLGSIEYAAAHTGCPLLVVLGHKNCGAVGAAVGALTNPDSHETPNVDDIIRRLAPAVVATKKDPTEAWIEAAVYRNVRDVCKQVTQRSPLLASFVEQGRYEIVGAVYDLGGDVEFL